MLYHDTYSEMSYIMLQLDTRRQLEKHRDGEYIKGVSEKMSYIMLQSDTKRQLEKHRDGEYTKGVSEREQTTKLFFSKIITLCIQSTQ